MSISNTKTDTTTTQTEQAQSLWLAAMPGVFVLLWSTGFIGAKFGLPYAEPFTFLFIRCVLTLLLIVPLLGLLRAQWPSSPALWAHAAVTGLLVHGAYLGGVFYSIYLGLPRAWHPCWSACNRYSPRHWLFPCWESA